MRGLAATLLLAACGGTTVTSIPAASCGAGLAWDLETLRCVPGCATDADCPGTACDPLSHACACIPGQALCDGKCVPESASRCGASCAACQPFHANTVGVCITGRCGDACAPGTHDCGAGCVAEDSSSCGASCAPCPVPPGGSAACVGGACVSQCPAALVLCDGACVTQEQCGGTPACVPGVNGCGPDCLRCKAPPGGVAVCDGACEIACAAGTSLCGGACVRDSNDSCGPSCAPCGAGTRCSAGKCVAACPSGVTFAGALERRPFALDSFEPLLTGDVDGDGRVDVLGSAVLAGGVIKAVVFTSRDGFQRHEAGANMEVDKTTSLVDLDGDGVLDLVGAGTQGVVVIAYGNGDGTFTSANLPVAMYWVSQVAVADVDGDGKRDLVVFGTDQSYMPHLLVLRGLGGRSFAAGELQSGPALSATPLVGDYDGDGREDLAIVSYGGLTVLYAEANGTFTSITPPGTFYELSDTFDADGDGRSDLFGYAVSGGATVLRMLAGRADRTFDARDAALPFGTPRQILVGDFDGDGQRDLLLAGDSLAIVRFQNHLPVPGPSWPAGPLANLTLVAGDFDGSGPTGVASNASGALVMAPITGHPTPGLELPGFHTLTLELADLDGDGRLDVLASGTDGAGWAVLVYKGNGDGTFTSASRIGFAQGVIAAHAADLDGDGRPELVVLAQDLVAVKLDAALRPVSTSVVRHVAPSASTLLDVEVLDADGDGRLDLALVESWAWDGTMHLELMRGLGGGAFGDLEHLYISWAWFRTAFVADVDMDGRPDLLLPEQGGVAVLRNTGSGFAAPVGSAVPIYDPMTAADLDGDGFPDLISRFGSAIGDGTGRFRDGLPTLNASAAVDLDGDGIPDVVIGSSTNLGVSLGAGQLIFNDGGSWQTDYLDVLATGDLDGDGRPDLISGESGRLDVFLTRCR